MFFLDGIFDIYFAPKVELVGGYALGFFGTKRDRLSVFECWCYKGVGRVI